MPFPEEEMVDVPLPEVEMVDVELTPPAPQTVFGIPPRTGQQTGVSVRGRAAARPRLAREKT